MNSDLKKIFSGVFALFLILPILFCSKKKEAESSTDASAKLAPYFTLPDINGKMVSLRDFKGKVLILDFWATWCPPCREEIPHFKDLYAQYKRKGLEIVGIAVDQGGTKAVKPFVEINRISYTILIGSEEVTNSYGGIIGIPTTFVIDRKGNIVRKYVGYREKEVFEEDIKGLL
ncbi:MAG: hypothetical protein A3C43_09745 [Candidatus Schekmanbacteria bacterium RIFCSPHIGHO2_02_FULL_38_11]|uniref:Thioredoxin domain-containing protein n=1 Tax=Candidatus Schekmanbacteria bacterium RIFCSPLOWO2_12_FULL_38_15 TaxID=1817883 RepID=A0A1F7SGV3_9BACT|nr:MAG: hypothetical protein A2043_04705 [Candidatus Schekmanbacteria bacterium GWA2_38_9]OGL49670.1 MAG: hypothetical protein A3H37_01370 [Candidatus Schekmanbacteria bacterium RIFCSPLOWO2_02_FULL_38_14]OGL51912.1 MAG: hypothetical protein A3C43_09745 [Candidatus Schekmanbacteria bacterium RIFCSPHIGHO2_02_FULL_38_11]OGL53023.1 MAG: hypothetical protein A3G31_08925 [Candidatus Schekmanbacteria bacterium RIFCSPLOWO2_12_FULL_38_15]